MSATDSTSHSMLERANQLYWQSDRTVEQIAGALRIGRSTLYAGVRPIPALRSCPECGEAMVFTSRSNRDAGTATCPSCTGSRWSRWREDLAAVSPQRAAMVGSAAALGAVVGAIGARVLRG